MSGGKKINDHAFWGGGPSKNSVLAEGVKVKQEAGVEGAGMESDFQDTAEKIRSAQNMAVKKAKAHKRDPMMRN